MQEKTLVVKAPQAIRVIGEGGDYPLCSRRCDWFAIGHCALFDCDLHRDAEGQWPRCRSCMRAPVDADASDPEQGGDVNLREKYPAFGSPTKTFHGSRYVPVRTAATQEEARAALRFLRDVAKRGKDAFAADREDFFYKDLPLLRDEFLDALDVVDKFLTDKNENRAGHADKWPTLVEEFRVVFYLSDGGYSRLGIDLLDGLVWLEESLSSAKVAERWPSIKTAAAGAADCIKDKYLKGKGVRFWIYALCIAPLPEGEKQPTSLPAKATRVKKNAPKEIAKDMNAEDKAAFSTAMDGDAPVWFIKLEDAGWDWTEKNGAKQVQDVQDVLEWINKFRSQKTVNGAKLLYCDVSNQNV